MKYIPGLNGLRAVAVFLVIFFHWGLPVLPCLSILKYILPDGRFGVNLFFVLSGFLITSILLIEKEKHVENPDKNKRIIITFYKRRFLRIFPIYYITLAILFFFNLPDFKTNLLFYLTYTENFRVYFDKFWDSFSHTWSLSVEEQFYLVWPFIIIFSKKSQLLSVLILFVFIGPAFSVIQTKVFGNGFNYYILTPTCFDAFGIGALLSYFYIEEKMEHFKKYIKILLPFAIILIFYWKLAATGGHFQYFRRFFESIVSCGLILFCLSNSFVSLRNKLLENEVMHQLGTVSYGIYLFHYPLPYLYWTARSKIHFSLGKHDLLISYALMLIILLFLAFLSYYFIEKPILNLKNGFKYYS